MEALYFTTEGVGFTELLQSFVKEGKFDTVFAILTEGNPEVSNKMVAEFMTKNLVFEGIASQDSDMFLKSVDTEPDYSLLTLGFLNIMKLYHPRRDKNHQRLLEIFDGDFPKEIKHAILVKEGYEILPKINDRYFDGVITNDGSIIECEDQGHNRLYPILSVLGYSNAEDWSDCFETLHISTGQLSGKVYSCIEHANLYEEVKISTEMLRTLWNNSEMLKVYGGGKSVGYSVIDYYKESLKLGGKLSGLHFIQEIYPSINLPKFDLEKISGVKNCIRTSPTLSLPGLLNSKFDINENSVNEILEDWKKHKNLRGTYKSYDGKVHHSNELTIFYQEFIEGANGVCQIINNKFAVQASEKQGDIVLGKSGTVKLSNSHSLFLEKFLEDISKKTKRDAQVEFVISNDNVYIVQLRILGKKKFDEQEIIDPGHNILYSGKVFSQGFVENLKQDEILFIEEDTESINVIGKKALIVYNNTEFSHALALSRALNIPSIFGTGRVDLPKSNITINATGKKGYIQKYKNE